METHVADFSRALLDHLPSFADQERVVALALYRQLALAAHVDDAHLAAATGFSTSIVREVLERPHFKSLTYRNPSGIIGFGGLAIEPMHHRLTVSGRVLYTWCAWDGLFIPSILGARAEIQSPCPATGTPIRIAIGPGGIESIEPPSSRISFLAPGASAFEGDVQQTMSSFCHFVFFFASATAAGPWIESHPGTILLAIEDGYRLGELLNASRWGIGSSSPTP